MNDGDWLVTGDLSIYYRTGFIFLLRGYDRGKVKMMMRWAFFWFKCWSSYTEYFIKVRACGDDDDAVVSHLKPVVIKTTFFLHY